MNSRWQSNKIGLINFWYYDNQEFSFIKGRMLLRGSNGSGKSMTMLHYFEKFSAAEVCMLPLLSVMRFS